MKLLVFVFMLLSSNIIFAQSAQDSSAINFLYQLQGDGDDLVVGYISYRESMRCSPCDLKIFSLKAHPKLSLKIENTEPKLDLLRGFQHTQILASLKKIKNKKLNVIDKDCSTTAKERQALYILYKGTFYSFVYIPCQSLDFAKILKEKEDVSDYLEILMVL